MCPSIFRNIFTTKKRWNFNFSWADEIDKSLPTMITVIGVFQYFEESRVIEFLKHAGEMFDDMEIIFDAMTQKAIRYANEHIRKTGNSDATLHFSTESGKAVAEKTRSKLSFGSSASSNLPVITENFG